MKRLFFSLAILSVSFLLFAQLDKEQLALEASKAETANAVIEAVNKAYSQRIN